MLTSHVVSSFFVTNKCYRLTPKGSISLVQFFGCTTLDFISWSYYFFSLNVQLLHVNASLDLQSVFRMWQSAVKLGG